MQIVCMTRWASGDLAGRLLVKEPENWHVLTMPAIDDNNNMLCEDILSLNDYKHLESTVDPLIFAANYKCELVDAQNRLYDIQTYQNIPSYWEKKICFVDVATSGNDYLCAICVGIINNQAFVLDLIHTKADSDITENLLVDMLIKNSMHNCRIESNAAGGLYAKNIVRKLAQRKIYNIVVTPFFQSKNKETRILTASSVVNRSVLLPQDWQKYKSFYAEILTYGREGKMKHDDGADTLSLVAEYITSNQRKGKLYF
jgi:predicted phage terminase large subunit-like protein